MTVRVTKPEFNLREKLTELDKPTGAKGLDLMRSETSQEARDLIGAGRRNLIINGSMAVAQRATSVSNQSMATQASPVCDRWRFRAINLDQATFDISQVTDAPKGVCTKSIKIDVNTAETALAADEIFWIAQTIEAQNCSDLGFGDSGASDLTISFYVKSNVVGKYAVYLYTQDPNRYISRTYTIDTAGVWERKIIHIPGDTAGSAIDHDGGLGIKIYWWQIAGSDYKSYDSTKWTDYGNSGIAYGHEVNMGSSTSNYWQLTGVQVERGSNATEFENRSFGEELALCQRYFFNVKGDNNHRSGIPGFANSTTNMRAMVQFPVPMRATPTVSGTATAMVFDSHDDSASFNCSSLVAGGSLTNTDPHMMVIEVNTSGMTNGQAGVLEFRADNGSINFDAEI